eukprot:COSAG06_NODE_8255_length_2223_cov_1.606403_1_plen_91_part_10
MYKGISHCLFRIARKEGMVRKTTTLFSSSSFFFFFFFSSFSSCSGQVQRSERDTESAHQLRPWLTGWLVRVLPRYRGLAPNMCKAIPAISI